MNVFECADFVLLALTQLQYNNTDAWVKDYAQCIVAVAIKRIHNYDNDWSHWIDIARRYLGVVNQSIPG